MNFNSLAFLIFLPAVLILWRVLPPKFRWVELLISSYVFYAWFNALLLIPIIAITFISYFAARGIAAGKTKKIKKTLLALTLTACLGTLFAFKYLDFCVGLGYSIANLFGAKATFSGFNIILPMGISFYTFQTLSCVIDVYRGTAEPERHYGYYSLFVVFFPQLVAGPIERPQNLIPQLHAAKNPNADDIALGVRKMIIGYAKKIIVADFVAKFVDFAYSSADSSGTVYALATALFAIQIYCDFSGYTDIAIGCARLMGIKLSENFARPYSAGSIREFWRRWHISLSSWFSDYVYKPLGGNRKGLWRQCLNLFIVFLLSGLWHGASLNFVVWGALHGAFLIINTLYSAVRKKSAYLTRASAKKWYKALAHILTLIAVWFAWIFFRAPSLGAAGNAIAAIFTDATFDITKILAGLGMNINELFTLGLALSLLVIIEDLPVYRVNTLPLARVENQGALALTYFAAFTAIAFFWLSAIASGGTGAFIYFRF